MDDYTTAETAELLANVRPDRYTAGDISWADEVIDLVADSIDAHRLLADVCPSAATAPVAREHGGGVVSANDPSSALNRIISTAQILDLRATGHADLVPSEFQRFDNDMLAKSLVLDAVKLLDEFGSES